MKKKLFIFGLLCFFLINSRVNAYTYSINSSKTTVYVGDSVTVTVKAEDVMGRYQVTSSDSGVLGGGDSDVIETPSAYTKNIVFSANGVGTAVITLAPIGQGMNVYSTEEPLYQRSITINVVKKATPPSININPTYNKNNNLSSLKIDGYDLQPSFSKDILEYSVTLEPGTEKINVSADVEHRTANVRGTGEVSVSEGINTIEVVVIAENGNEKIYKILAEVHEKDPINVKIGKEEYTVIKKKELISTKEGYRETTVKINDFDIPALYNDIVGVTLIGLKDKDGNISLFSYDTKTGKYSDYREFKFDLMNLYIHENNESKYKKVNMKINDTNVIAYKLEGIIDYYLLYATNTATGYEGYYLYDTRENSVQRYDSTMLDALTKERDKYLYLVLVLSSVCFLTMLFLLIEVNRDNKRKNEE